MIEVHVKAGSKRELVTQLDANTYKVEVKAPPIDGRANEAVIAALALFFGIPKSRIIIKRGLTGKKKWVEVLKSC